MYPTFMWYQQRACSNVARGGYNPSPINANKKGGIAFSEYLRGLLAAKQVLNDF